MPITYPKILFGTTEFGEGDFVEARLTEEFSPLSVTFPISTLDFSIYSDNLDFSVINPTGAFETLATIQPIAVYEMVGGTPIYLGQFYLKDWENKNEKVKSFTAYNAVGLLDRITYRGGLWLTPVTVGSLIANILDSSNLGYEIDPEVAAIELTGWLPISTAREALQQVAFAASAYLLVSRRDTVIVGRLAQSSIEKSGIRVGVGRTGQTRVWQLRWRPTQTFVYTASGVVTQGLRSSVGKTGQSRNWQKKWRPSQWEGVKPLVEISAGEHGGRSLNLRPLITGVEITAHDLTSATGKMDVLDQTMVAGVHEVHFLQPLHDLVITGATITESGANYAIITVATPGAVKLTGQVYISTDTIYGRYLDPVPGRKDNIIKVEDGTLVTKTNGAEICEKLFNYYQQRYIQKMKLFAPSGYIEVGSMVDVETLYSNRLFGVIERMDTDLTGGFVAETEVTGIIK